MKPSIENTFIQMLRASWKAQQSLLCVGLDPVLEKLPQAICAQPTPLFAFNREIIDATATWACAFKPQIAHYAALGAESQLEQSIAYIKQHYPHIPVILDAKRGDIGATALMYAREVFARYGADAVTLNPYLGGDTLTPFLDYADGDKGVFVLCRTSNPGSGEFQQLQSGERTLAQHVAKRAVDEWNDNGNVGLVVGATMPEEVGAMRALVGDMPLLVPGIGAQGGDLEAVMANGLDSARDGLLINVSRAIIFAGKGEGDFAEAAGKSAQKFCDQINALR